MICLLGPTASGKTKYAVHLAQDIGGEIISADSRQVYRGMTIGTGKDLKEYGDVPYHLIDIVDAGEKYDIFRYQRDFTRAYHNVVSKGKMPILCGGSGLYIEAVTRGYQLQEVPPNLPLREKLEKLSDQDLIAEFESLKTPHNVSDYDSRKRLIRALEIAIYHSEHPKEEDPTFNRQRVDFKDGEVKYFGINISREERNRRIDARLDARLSEGMVEEVQGLLDGGISPGDLIYYGLEYKYITLYLIGELSYVQMRERLAIAIHQFAKRQMTWFRGMERRGINIEWIF